MDARWVRIVVGLLGCMLGAAAGSLWADGPDYYYSERGERIGLSIASDEGGRLTVLREGFDESSPRVLSNQFVVRVADPARIDGLAAEWGARVTGTLPFDRSLVVLEAGSARDALRIANHAWERSQVQQVFTQFESERVARQLPNDPSFANQWHLRNTGQGGGLANHDVNVNPVWNFTAGTGLGTGVLVGVVDSRVQSDHPDLVANLRTDRSLWLAGTAGSHGTSVAGVVAGVGNNGIGISGVAPGARFAGISLLNQSGTDANEAAALSNHFNTMNGAQFDGIHIYNNSWGPTDNAIRSAPGALVLQALQSAVTTGRGGLGNIYLWAGGNGGGLSTANGGDNVNYDGYASSRFVIAVGSTTNGSVRSGYSERGASLLVNAPSNGGSLGITTTTTGSGYTSSFGGTSSATPAASGVVALMLEANPGLGWRDVKHILVNTSRRTDTNNASWILNGAGRYHSDLYGFGTVDAAAAVAAAANWNPVGPELVDSTLQAVNVAIAGGTGTVASPVYGAATTRSITVSQNLLVESVEVVFTATGGFEGNLEIMLTSPSGTQSFLALPNSDGADYLNWTFQSVKNWGESSLGTWSLRVRDGVASNTSTWGSWRLNVYGTLNAIPEPTTGLIAMVFAAAMLCTRGRRSGAVG